MPNGKAPSVYIIAGPNGSGKTTFATTFLPDFAFETTLSGLTYLNWLKQFKKLGYSIHMYYLWVADIDLALARIKERVMRGGHHVPAKDVRRRYKRSISDLFQKYGPLVDSWTLFDNSSGKPHITAQMVGGNLTVHEVELFDKIKGNFQ